MNGRGVFAALLAVVAGSCTAPIGRQGERGPAGRDGAAGQDGYTTLAYSLYGAPSCDAGGVILLAGPDLDRSSTLDASEVTSSAEVCNGLAGQDGSDAPPSPFTPTEVVDPCGDTANVFDEVLLRLADGTLLASFSDDANGRNTRFARLVAGTYQTTDGSGCVFTVGADGSIQ